MYQAGTYREQILHAIRHRDRIDEVLGRYRTKAAPAAETEEEAAELAESVANDEDDRRRRGESVRALPLQALVRSSAAATPPT